jgi:hypothetical protein
MPVHRNRVVNVFEVIVWISVAWLIVAANLLLIHGSVPVLKSLLVTSASLMAIVAVASSLAAAYRWYVSKRKGE